MKGCFVRSFRLSQGAAYNENEAAASELGQQLGVAAAKADTPLDSYARRRELAPASHPPISVRSLWARPAHTDTDAHTE